MKLFDKKVPFSVAGLLPVAALALTAGLFLARPASSQVAGAQALNIAIANPAKIAEELTETKALQASWDVDTKDLLNQKTDQEKHLETTRQKLVYYKPNTPQYTEQENVFLKESIGYDAWLKEHQLMMARRQKQALKDLFLEIEAAAGQVAAKRGVTLVIADQRPQIPDDLEQVPDANVLKQLIAQRTVLFADPTRDLSGEIITLLNNNYASKTQH